MSRPDYADEVSGHRIARNTNEVTTEKRIDPTIRRGALTNSKELAMSAQPKAVTWTGRVITGLVVAFMIFSAVGKFLAPPEVVEQVEKLGYTKELIFQIGIVEVVCVIIYAVPQTAVLGAILLTGYLGGAINTHVRVNEPFIFPIILGVLVWLGIFLREPRLRALMPWRNPAPINKSDN